MENNNIINIINFTRAVEPRDSEGRLDLFEPMRNQMRLAKQYGLPTTWLLQYDALISGPFVDFLKKEMPENHEIGIWFEIVQPNVEAVGLKWRGRYAWDWHVNVGFPHGYTPEEREKIADEFISRFESIFGYKPKVMGSWMLDAHLLEYMQKKHGIVGACICKDQYGTDGYTLWGGYWANAYYPSKFNSYMPAQHMETQLSVPIFRMLGSDPLYQYDAQQEDNCQSVISLEPVYKIGGGAPTWCDWFFAENCNQPNFAMSYAQVGQENSFGWHNMQVGIEYQYKCLAELRDQGKYRIEKLSDSGIWFKSKFSRTPVSVVITRNDWKHEGREGIWYLSAASRMNLFVNQKRLLLRDWQLFDENYEEEFLRHACSRSSCAYDALPVLDSLLCGTSLYLPDEGHIGDITQESDEILHVEWIADPSDARTLITIEPQRLKIEFPVKLIAVELNWDLEKLNCQRTEITVVDNLLHYCHHGRKYQLKVVVGQLRKTAVGVKLFTVDGVLELITILIGE